MNFTRSSWQLILEQNLATLRALLEGQYPIANFLLGLRFCKSTESHFLYAFHILQNLLITLNSYSILLTIRITICLTCSMKRNGIASGIRSTNSLSSQKLLLNTWPSDQNYGQKHINDCIRIL